MREMIFLLMFLLCGGASVVQAQDAPATPTAARYVLSDNGQMVMDVTTGHLWMLDKNSVSTKPTFKPVRYTEERSPSDMQSESKMQRYSFQPTYGR